MILLSRICLVALVIGTSVTVASTERVDLALVVSGTVGWSFVPLIQLSTGLLLVRGAAQGTTRALEQYFGTHWPWSFWILAVHGTMLLVPAARAYGSWLMITAAVPVIWTARLLMSLCRDTLGIPPAAARRRVVVHQAVTGAIGFAYIAVAVALWPRIVGWFQ